MIQFQGYVYDPDSEVSDLRPIKEILREEYWNIAYRFCSDGETLLDGKCDAFSVLPESKRYWYADPFLFEHGGKVYLFVEMFDNVTEKGLIGVSVLCKDGFSVPKVVIEESFHLSYPFVFEENGEIYMMPETMDDGCIQLYRAVDFPEKWEKKSVLVREKGMVDAVICGEWLIASRVTDTVSKETQLQLFNRQTGEAHPINESVQGNQTSRGAGRIFNYGDKQVRPAQNCLNGVYGAGLVFYSVDEISDVSYSETEIFRLEPSQVKLKSGSPAEGVHTYARCGTVEVVDIKKHRLNFRRVLWIVAKKT